jgi:hypothetical protein
MNQHEQKKTIVFSILVEIKDRGQETIKPKIVPYDYYKTESFWGNKKQTIKLLFGLSLIGTAFISFIALLIMW